MQWRAECNSHSLRSTPAHISARLNAMKSGVQHSHSTKMPMLLRSFECNEERSATPPSLLECKQLRCVWMQWRAECNFGAVAVELISLILVWMQWRAECNNSSSLATSISPFSLNAMKSGVQLFFLYFLENCCFCLVWMQWRAECNHLAPPH